MEMLWYCLSLLFTNMEHYQIIYSLQKKISNWKMHRVLNKQHKSTLIYIFAFICDITSPPSLFFINLSFSSFSVRCDFQKNLNSAQSKGPWEKIILLLFFFIAVYFFLKYMYWIQLCFLFSSFKLLFSFEIPHVLICKTLLIYINWFNLFHWKDPF